jgi:hypothetical protein
MAQIIVACWLHPARPQISATSSESVKTLCYDSPPSLLVALLFGVAVAGG